MDIAFKNKKLGKSFIEGKELEKVHGVKRASKIRVRMKELRAAESLMDFWPPFSPPSRCHELKGKLKGHFSVDLDHPYRLIFTHNYEDAPLKQDGGIDWVQVTFIRIIGIEDTHE